MLNSLFNLPRKDGLVYRNLQTIKDAFRKEITIYFYRGFLTTDFADFTDVRLVVSYPCDP